MRLQATTLTYLCSHAQRSCFGLYVDRWFDLGVCQVTTHGEASVELLRTKQALSDLRLALCQGACEISISGKSAVAFSLDSCFFMLLFSFSLFH